MKAKAKGMKKMRRSSVEELKKWEILKKKNARKMKDIKQKNNKEDVNMVINNLQKKMVINKNRGDKLYEKEVRYECNKKNKRDNW